MVRGKFLGALALGVAASAVSTQAVTAQEAWPDGPIQIVVPWSAGGATDAVMRVLAGEVSDALEVPVTAQSIVSQEAVQPAAATYPIAVVKTTSVERRAFVSSM